MMGDMEVCVRRVVLLGLVGLLLSGCSSGDVFTFAEDDLCEWVSEDEVTSFVKKAYDKSGVEWAGSAVAVPHQGSAWDVPGVYCRWEPTGGGWVIARGLKPSSFGSGAVEFSEVGDEVLFPLGPGPVSGHPDFADNIIIANAAFGRLGFWLQDSDEALGLEAYLPDGVSDDDWAEQEKMLSVVANSFLKEMGWTP
jgi:hypothetical protein